MNHGCSQNRVLTCQRAQLGVWGFSGLEGRAQAQFISVLEFLPCLRGWSILSAGLKGVIIDLSAPTELEQQAAFPDQFSV